MGLLLMMAVLLAGCASGPKKRIFPPEARLQQLQLDEDGRWQLQLRLHNYSNVPMTFTSIEAALQIGDVDAGRMSLSPRLTIAANSVELLNAPLSLPPAASQALDQAVATGSGIGYRLSGSIVSSDPRGSHRFEFSSRLHPVPGLGGVLR
jgi:hypothetical protein